MSNYWLTCRKNRFNQYFWLIFFLSTFPEESDEFSFSIELYWFKNLYCSKLLLASGLHLWEAWFCLALQWKTEKNIQNKKNLSWHYHQFNIKHTWNGLILTISLKFSFIWNLTFINIKKLYRITILQKSLIIWVAENLSIFCWCWTCCIVSRFFKVWDFECVSCKLAKRKLSIIRFWPLKEF